MTTITITETILDGNLGDGWGDNAYIADALADYTQKIWENDLESYSAQGHTIIVDIRVQYSASGYSKPLTVDVDDADDDHKLEKMIQRSLTPMNTIWETFCKQIA